MIDGSVPSASQTAVPSPFLRGLRSALIDALALLALALVIGASLALGAWLASH